MTADTEESDDHVSTQAPNGRAQWEEGWSDLSSCEWAQHGPELRSPGTRSGVCSLLLKQRPRLRSNSMWRGGCDSHRAALQQVKGPRRERRFLTQIPFPSHLLPEKAVGRGYLTLGGTYTQ